MVYSQANGLDELDWVEDQAACLEDHCKQEQSQAHEVGGLSEEGGTHPAGCLKSVLAARIWRDTAKLKTQSNYSLGNVVIV